MKSRLRKQIFFYASIALLLVSITVIGEEVPNNSIKIDRHWIYIFQLDDLKTFEVNEYFFINNTGKSSFNDSINIWIQNNSFIAADCCNYTSNMACRYNATRGENCFYLNKSDDTNLYFGYPILSNNSLSYYGLREKFSITAFSTTNTSLTNATLELNATIGDLSVQREQKNFHGSGIHLTSENLDIGLQPVINLYMPFNIMKIENITIFNNGTANEVISFLISDLPRGWAVEIWNKTRKIDNVSLSPKEFANLSLIITAPSNIASIYVRYTTQLGIDENNAKGLFTKQYLYETEKVTYEVYLFNTDELEISSDLKMVHDEIFWREEYGRYWFIARNNDVQPNSLTMISMKLEKTKNIGSNPYLILLLLFIIILIIGLFFLTKIDFFKEKETLQKRENFPEKRIKELQDQKKKILSSIKRVEREFEEKIINKNDYEKLRAAYKKQAVKILKEIDQLKK
jgi:hypothetical protein